MQSPAARVTLRWTGTRLCEDTAKMLLCPVPLRLCTVSFKSPTGVTHGVDVEAETLYEAAGMALARLTEDGWIEGLGPGSRLEIEVREPSTQHSLTVQQLHRWIDCCHDESGRSPATGSRQAVARAITARVRRVLS